MSAANVEAEQLTRAVALSREAGPRQSRNQDEKQESSFPTILIFGANGNVGSATVKAIHQHFRHEADVRIAVRDVDKAKKQFVGFRNVEIVHADTKDPKSLHAALTGVPAVFIITPGNGNGRSDAVEAYIKAVKDIGTVKFLLFTALPTTGNEKLIFGREWGKYHQLVKASGVRFCWLQLPMFCENFWGNVGSIKGNKAIYAPITGDGHFNYVSVQDIGIAAAYILSNYQQHINTTYTITGPSTTCYNDLVKDLKPIAGDISFYQATKEQAVAGMVQAMNFPTWQAEGIVELYEYSLQSADGKDGRAITKDFETLTGKKPTSFADFLNSIAYVFNDKFKPPVTPDILPTILISGATGNVGQHAVRHLHTKYSHQVKVLAAVRDKTKATNQFKSLHGLELVYYDTNDVTSLNRAFRGVDAFFLIPPNPNATTDRSKSTFTQIEAAKKAGVKFILLLDLLVGGNEKYAFGREWAKYVDAIKATKIPLCQLKCPMFVENWWGSVGSLKGQNAFYFPVGADIKFNYTSVSDVGIAAAEILSNPQQHINHTHVLTGPSLTTNAEIASELSTLTKRTINFYQATPEQAIEAMKGFGMPEWQAKGIVELWNFHTSGQGLAHTVSSDYHKLTELQPTDMKDFLKQLATAI